MPKDIKLVPVRDLEQEARLKAEAINQPVFRYELDDNYVSADRYSIGSHYQAVGDWTRNRAHIYINGVPLNAILNILKVPYVRNALNNFFGEQANPQIREDRLQAFHPFYTLVQLLAGKDVRNANYSIDEIADDAALIAFMDIYEAHQQMFDTLAEKNPKVEALNHLMQNNCVLFFLDSSENSSDNSFKKVWEEVLRNYLFAGASEEVQNAFITMMVSYAHQGGVMTPAALIVMEALGIVNFFDKTEFKADIFNGFQQSTMEYTFDSGNNCLVIRDKTPIAKLYSSLDEKDIEIEFEGHNIVEYDVKHVADYNPHNKSVMLRIDRAYGYADASTWDFINKKIILLARLKTMLPHLQAYANNYLTHKHNSSMANHIFNLFPELDQITPRKSLGFFALPGQHEHNKFDKILAALGQLSPEYGKTIRQNLAKHLLFENTFVNAMKLLLRLDDGKSTISMLMNYLPTKQDSQALYAERTLRALYTRICRGYIGTLNFDKLLDEEADIFVHSSLLMTRHGCLDQLESILADDLKRISVDKKLVQTEQGLYHIYGKIADEKMREKQIRPKQAASPSITAVVELDEAKEEKDDVLASSSPRLRG
jgi:hypothetical protein